MNLECAPRKEIAPRPIEKPQVVPPIRISEKQKKHIKKTGKK